MSIEVFDILVDESVIVNASIYDYYGPKGDKGNSILSGSGTPSNEIGNIGDTYINLLNWEVYKKNENGWNFSGNSLIGPQGVQASNVLSGSGDPSNVI